MPANPNLPLHPSSTQVSFIYQMNLALTYDELSLPHRPGMQRPKSFSGLTCEMYEEVCRRTDFIGLLSPDLRWLQASAK